MNKFILISAAALLFSCSSDDTQPETTPEVNVSIVSHSREHMNTDITGYYIYRHTVTLTSGSEVALSGKVQFIYDLENELNSSEYVNVPRIDPGETLTLTGDWGGRIHYSTTDQPEAVRYVNVSFP